MDRIISRLWAQLGVVGLVVCVFTVVAAGCGGSKSVDDWLKQLNDPEVVLRRQACRQLADMAVEAPRTAGALAQALRDENWYVRRDAAVALGKLGPPAGAAVPVLVASLSDKERSVRTAAAAALKKIDPAAASRAGVH
jgi:HEAT repeat protein